MPVNKDLLNEIPDAQSLTKTNTSAPPATGGNSLLDEIPDANVPRGTIDKGKLNQQIADIESDGGDYSATNPNSSATGKHQFLWSLFGDDIKKVTGVRSRQEFLDTPTAQEKFFDYHVDHNLVPTVNKIKKFNKQGYSDMQLAKLVHFKGEQGAIDFLEAGADNTHEHNVSIPKYIGKPEGITPPPPNPTTAPMQSMVNGTDHQQDATDLGISSDFANNVLGADFGKPNTKQPTSVEAGGHVYTIQDGQKMKVENPVEYSQHVIGKEINANTDLIKNDVDRTFDILPDAIKQHVDKNQLIQTLTGPTGGTKELEAYYNAKVTALKDKYDLDKHRATRLQGQEGGHTFTLEEANKFRKEDEDFQKQGQEEIAKLHRAVFNTAAVKTVNDMIADGTPVDKINPGNIGRQVRTVLGEGPQMDKVDNQVFKSGNTENLAQQDYLNDQIGIQALQFSRMKAFADGNLPLAKDLTAVANDANKKIWERNPVQKRQQIIKAISDQAYENANPLYTSIGGYHVTKENVMAIGKQLGLPEADYKDIDPAEIKKVPNIVNRVVGGFLNSTALPLADLITPQDKDGVSLPEVWHKHSTMGKMLGGDMPEASMSVKQPKVDTDPHSPTYLQNITDENTGNINWSAGSIANQVAEGTGGFLGFVGEAGVIGKGLEGAGVIKNTANAERIANAATVMLSTYKENYRQGQELFGDNEVKKHTYAMVNSLLMAATNEILPKTKIAGDILGTNTIAGREFISQVEKNGIESLTQPQLKQYITKGLGEFAKTQGIMLGISEINTVGNNISKMVMAPDANVGVMDNTKETAVNSVLSMMIPSIATGVMQPHNQTLLHKEMLFDVGTNSQKYIDELNAQVKSGKMDPEKGKISVDLVNQMADIVKTSVPKESTLNGKPLTHMQQVDYANNLLQEQLLQKKKESIKDKVQTRVIDENIKNLETERETILSHAGEPEPTTTEESPQNKVSPKNKENGNSKESGTQTQNGNDRTSETTSPTAQSNEPEGINGQRPGNSEGQRNVLNEHQPSTTQEDVGAKPPTSSLGFEEEPGAGFEDQPVATNEHVDHNPPVAEAPPEVKPVEKLQQQSVIHDERAKSLGYHNADVLTTDAEHNPNIGHEEKQVIQEYQDHKNAVREHIAEHPEDAPVVTPEENSPAALRRKNLSAQEETRLSELEQADPYTQHKHAHEMNVLRNKAYNSPEEEKHTTQTNHIKIEDALKDGRYQEWIKAGRMSPEDAKVIIESAGLPVPEDIMSHVREVPAVPEPVKVEKPALTEAAPAPGEEDKSSFLKVRSEPEQKESAKVGDNIKQKFEKASKIIGHDGETTLPNGQTVPGRYVLTDADAITPSHNPNTYRDSEGFPMMENGKNPNDRNYELKKNIEAVEDHATNYNGLAVKNTPTVDKNGVVIDGNDRTMSGQIAARNKTDGEYINNLKKNAKLYGFTEEDVQGMIDKGHHPRLIFVPDEVQPYTTKTFAKFNKETQKPKNAFELAIEHHRNLSDNLVERIGNVLDRHEEMGDFFRSAGDQKEVHNLLMKEGVLNPTNSSQYYDGETRTFNDEGKKLVQNIMLAKTLDEEALRTIQKHPALAEKILKSIKNIVAIDAVAKYGLAETVNSAIKLYHNVDEYMDKANIPKKDKQKGLEMYLRQSSLFEGPTEESKATINIYTALANMGSRAFKDFIGKIHEAAKPAEMGVDLFGNERATKSDLLNQAHDAIAEFERAKLKVYPEPVDAPEHGQTDIKAAVRDVPEPGKTDALNEQTVGENQHPGTPATEPVSEDVILKDYSKGLKKDDLVWKIRDMNGDMPALMLHTLSKPELVSKYNKLMAAKEKLDAEKNAKISIAPKDINAQLADKAEELNDYNHKVNLVEGHLTDMRNRGETDTDAYKVKLKAWQQVSGKLDKARKEFDALSRKRQADAMADKIRSKKIKGGNDGMIYGAGPIGVIAKLAQVVGKELINGGLEVAALAVQAGYHIKVAIDRAVEYINKHYKGDWDEKQFRDAMGEHDLFNNEASPADKAAALRKMMAGENTLTKKNEAVANSLISDIHTGKATLGETIDKIKSDAISEPTKKAIINYISKAVNGDRNRFVYDEAAQRTFTKMVREKVVEGKQYDEVVNELEANPLMRGQKLNFQERETIQNEVARHKVIQDVLNDTSPLKDKTAVRSVMRNIAESAFVHDDSQLTEVLNNVDSRYQVQSHKDLTEYVDDIVKTFGPEQSERIAIQQGLNPARRQLLLAKVADEYKSAGNQSGLENMLSKIAYNATQYGQGVEATKLVYKLLGMTGGKGATAYIHALIDNIQNKFLAAHKSEVDGLKKQVNDLKQHVADLMKTDKKVAADVQKALKKAGELSFKAHTEAVTQHQKLTEVLDRNLSTAKGKLITPQDIYNMRTKLAKDVAEALPLLSESEKQEWQERVGDLFNQHIKDINEGHLAKFYNDVMFPGDKPPVDRSTRIAEDLMNTVNASTLANGKIDQMTLDAIHQKYGIDVKSKTFVDGLNELVDRANAHPEGLEKGKSTFLKDDIAKLIKLHNPNEAVSSAMKGLGLTARDIHNMDGNGKKEAWIKIRDSIEKDYNSMSLTGGDVSGIIDKSFDQFNKLLTEEKDRRNTSKPENAQRDLLDYYNKEMFPDKSRFDNKDTKIADELTKVVNASNTVNGPDMDQHTLDAIIQKHGLTVTGDGFAKALQELVDRVNADPASREAGADTRLKDDIAKLVRLYAVPDAIAEGNMAHGIKMSDLATKLGSIQDGSLQTVQDHLMKEYGKLGLTTNDAAELAKNIHSRYSEMLKDESNKFLQGAVGKKLPASQQKALDTFYDKVVKEVSALRLGDPAFQQLFAEKHGLKPFTPADFDVLRAHAEKAKFLKPGSSEYGQQVEKFFAHIQNKDPEYVSNIYKGLRASKLLFSIGFTMKTAFSNVVKVYTRGLTEYARSVAAGRGDAQLLRLTFPNIQRLFGGEAMDKYASNYIKYVLQGGIPVSNTYEQEFAQNASHINTRLEEYKNADDSWYIRTAKAVMKVGSRLQNSVDSYGQVRSSEIVEYSRILQGVAEELKQLNPAVTPDEIRAEAQRRFALTDKTVAQQKARDEFAKVKEPIDENSARFKNRVMEIQREHRDEEAFNFARNLSRKDFWKESEHGLMGGVGGLMETTLSKFRDILRKPLETHPKAELVYDGAMFQLFGFLGGASRFYEDSLEHILPYSLLKAGLLQLGKKADLTPEEKELIDRKQFDMISKGAMTLLATAGAITSYNFMKSIATAGGTNEDKDKWGWFGSGDAYNISEAQAYKGLPKNGFLIAGHKIPFDFFVPQQMDVPTRIYANLEDYARTHDEKSALQHFLFAAGHALPQSPWDGSDKKEIFKAIGDIFSTNEMTRSMGQQKLQDIGYRKIGEFVTAYVPIPQRIISESYQLFDQGQKAKIEPTLPISAGDKGLDYVGKMFINFGSRAIFSTSQALGINNILSTAGVLNKPALDYRGREINTGTQYSNSFAAVPHTFSTDKANPLPHDQIDEMLVSKQLKINYYSRYGNSQMLFYSKKNSDYYQENNEGEKQQKYTNETRYMTDHEYYDFQTAMGKITNEELTSRYENWKDVPAGDVKSSWTELQKNIFEHAKKGVENGMDADQIISSWKSGTHLDLPAPSDKDQADWSQK